MCLPYSHSPPTGRGSAKTGTCSFTGAKFGPRWCRSTQRAVMLWTLTAILLLQSSGRVFAQSADSDSGGGSDQPSQSVSDSDPARFLTVTDWNVHLDHEWDVRVNGPNTHMTGDFLLHRRPDLQGFADLGLPPGTTPVWIGSGTVTADVTDPYGDGCTVRGTRTIQVNTVILEMSLTQPIPGWIIRGWDEALGDDESHDDYAVPSFAIPLHKEGNCIVPPGSRDPTWLPESTYPINSASSNSGNTFEALPDTGFTLTQHRNSSDDFSCLLGKGCDGDTRL